MNLSKSILSTLALLLITALSGTAFAQLKANPVYGQRNLTNAKNSVEIIAGPLGNYGGGGLVVTDGAEIGLGLNLGAAYGVNNDLSIGAMAAPLTITPDFSYNNPTLFGKYRFLHGSFEAAGALGLVIPVQSGSDFGMAISVPMRNRGTLRLDVIPTLNLAFADSVATSVAVPIHAFYNIQQDLFVGLVTGLNFVNDFNTISVPLGIGAGYTLQAPEGPMLDLTATFTVPGFVSQPDPIGSSFVVDSGWAIGLGGSYHLYL